MAIKFLLLLLLLTLIAFTNAVTAQNASQFNQTETQFNQTELQAAISDLRGRSYYGYVILLKLLNTSQIPLKNGDITFLVPDDQELSAATIGADHVHNFMLSHTIPSALAFGNLLRLPTGTLVPTNVPTKKLTFSNYGKAGIVLNNAKIVRPNMCNTTYLVKCHGISAALTF